MNYFKLIIKSLSKRKVITVLLVIQLTISFVMLFFSIGDMVRYSIHIDNIRQTMNYPMDRTVRIKFILPEENLAYIKRVNKLGNYIESLDEVKEYGVYYMTGTIFEELVNDDRYINKEMDDLEALAEAYPNVELDFLKNEWQKSSNILFVDKGIYGMVKLNVISGRNLNDEDFPSHIIDLKEKPVPMLIGYEYKNTIPIGTIITYETPFKKIDTKYEVVGILGKNSRWFSQDCTIKLPVKSIDAKFIMPIDPEEKECDYIAGLTALSHKFFLMDEDTNYKIISDKILEKANEFDINIELETLEESLNNYIKEIESYEKMRSFVNIMFTVAATLSIIASVLSSIVYRKKEFGIQIAVGADLRDIKRLIIGEIGFMILFSAIIAYSICLYKTGNITLRSHPETVAISNVFRSYGYGFIPLVTIVITALASIVPIKQISKLQPVELIGGNE